MKDSRTPSYSQGQSQMLNTTSFAPVAWLHCVLVGLPHHVPDTPPLSSLQVFIPVQSATDSAHWPRPSSPPWRADLTSLCPPNPDTSLSSAQTPAPLLQLPKIPLLPLQYKIDFPFLVFPEISESMSPIFSWIQWCSPTISLPAHTYECWGLRPAEAVI